MPNPTVTLEGEFSAGVWTDVSADLLARGRVVLSRGIQGEKPKDLVARQGSMRFVLNNASTNIAGALGNYSPDHGSARSGFDLGTRFRLRLKDDSHAEAAPLTSPRTAEPGPGTLTIVDTENKLSISGGQLVCSGGKATPAAGDPGAWGAAHTTATGLAAIFSITPGATNASVQVGWDDDQAIGITEGVLFRPAARIDLRTVDGNSAAIGTYSAAKHEVAVIPWSGGANIFIRGGIYDNWTLLYRTVNALASTSYPGISNFNATYTADHIRTAQLPAPFDTDYGLATDQLAGARTAGDTFTHEADGILEFTVTTLQSSFTMAVAVRRVDDDNRWTVAIGSTGNIFLVERVAASSTNRISGGGGSVTSGDRVVLIMDGNDYRLYVDNTLIGTYTDPSSYFVTETSGRLRSEGTGGSVSDIVTWPRTITSGAAYTSLERLADGTSLDFDLNEMFQPASIKFYGKATSIEPEAGQYRGRGVEVECRDYIGELNDQKISLLGVQTDKRNDQIVTTLVAEASTAPKNTSYGTGPDTFAYALHTDKDEGTTIINAVQKAMQSGLDYFYVKGDASDGETLVYESRHDRIKNTTLSATFNDDMRDIRAERIMKRVNNKVTTVSYPVEIDAAATTVLYSLQREIQVLPGTTFTLTARYTDPSGAGRRISGLEIVDPLVADTHFKVSSVAGDNGNDLNGDVNITLTVGANATEVAIQNTSANTGYLNKLEILGKGIYLYDPVEYTATDATSVAAYGERPLKYDLPNQDNPNTGVDFGDYLLATYKDPGTTIESLRIRGNSSASFLEEVITLDIGDRISATETVTGIGNEYFIQGYQIVIEEGRIIDAEYTLKQAGGSEFWFLGDVGFSELGDTTILGF